MPCNVALANVVHTLYRVCNNQFVLDDSGCTDCIGYKKGVTIIKIRLRLCNSIGAEGEIRTPTSIRSLDPEPSASTNSATSA